MLRSHIFLSIILTRPLKPIIGGIAKKRVDRETIVEVSSLASRTPAVSVRFMTELVLYGEELGFDWAFFTATSRLEKVLRRMRLPLIALGAASANRVPNPEIWGSYYETDPRVLAFGREQLMPFLLKKAAPAPCSAPMRLASMAKLAQALARHAAAAGSQIAMSDGRRSPTRSELAAWVAGVAQDLGPTHETVGIFGNNSVEWAVAFLAASVAGKTIVPVPVFFSEGQRDHLIRDAGISRVIVTDAESPHRGIERRIPFARAAYGRVSGAGQRWRPHHLHLGQHRKSERRPAHERPGPLERGDLGEGHRREQLRTNICPCCLCRCSLS